MNTDGGTKDDVKLPDNKLGEEILAGFEVADTVMVTVTAAMGEEQVRPLRSALAIFRFLTRLSRLRLSRSPISKRTSLL